MLTLHDFLKMTEIVQTLPADVGVPILARMLEGHDGVSFDGADYEDAVRAFRWIGMLKSCGRDLYLDGVYDCLKKFDADRRVAAVEWLMKLQRRR